MKHYIGACPPCPKTVTVSCHCGKQKPRVVRCSAKQWSCGKPCGRKLLCGHHNCQQPCHTGSYHHTVLLKGFYSIYQYLYDFSSLKMEDCLLFKRKSYCLVRTCTLKNIALDLSRSEVICGVIDCYFLVVQVIALLVLKRASSHVTVGRK